VVLAGETNSGLGTRVGHRTAAGAGIAQRGGKRVKKAAAADSE